MFEKERYLKEHIKIHSDKKVTDKIYDCAVCTKLFSCNSALKKHIDSQHKIKNGLSFIYFEEKKNDFTCKFCNKKCRDAYNLDRHVNQMHFETMLNERNPRNLA